MSWAQALAVFSLARLLSAIPLTPGGLGIVELALIAGLYAAGRHHVGYTSRPEDLVSDVWLEVASGLGRFRGDEAAFRAWVFTIARRRLIDQRRMAPRRNTTAMPPEALARVVGTGDAEEEALAALGTDAAISCLAALPADQAQVMLLRMVADLSLVEVAAVLGKRAGAVRALQHRALRRLARTISRQGITK